MPTVAKYSMWTITYLRLFSTFSAICTMTNTRFDTRAADLHRSVSSTRTTHLSVSMTTIAKYSIWTTTYLRLFSTFSAICTASNTHLETRATGLHRSVSSTTTTHLGLSMPTVAKYSISTTTYFRLLSTFSAICTETTTHLQAHTTHLE